MDSASTNRAIRTATETQQERVWKGDFGREYTERNAVDTESVDQHWRRNYGVARSTINESFLGGISKDAKFLEVGCNAGNQLLMLKQMGWTNLSGTELQPFAMEMAGSRLPDATFKLGSALALPWEDGSFDVVFTCGVLIHISPKDLSSVLDEIYRTTREYIWGTEYYAPEVTEVRYRDHSELLWKMDFAKEYMQRFPDLELVKEQHLPYLDNANVDAVFLLRKKRRQ